jgi:hypothetical protein
MHTFTAQVPLPFYLRLRGQFQLIYDSLPVEERHAALSAKTFRVCPVARTADVGGSGMPVPRATLEIALEFDELPEELRCLFEGALLHDLLVIANHVIDAYRSASRESSNAGFIARIGLSHLQMFAELDGEDLRDRWPQLSHSHLPLSPRARAAFLSCLADSRKIVPESIFLCEAMIALQRVL